jgi:hypothetical protein
MRVLGEGWPIVARRGVSRRVLADGETARP